MPKELEGYEGSFLKLVKENNQEKKGKRRERPSGSTAAPVCSTQRSALSEDQQKEPQLLEPIPQVRLFCLCVSAHHMCV